MSHRFSYSGRVGRELFKETAVLLKVAVAEELIDGTLARVAGEPRRLGPVTDKRLDRGAEGGQIGWLVYEQAVLVIADLVGDAPDRARDDRPFLPHRLRDGEAEALGEALLDDDRRVALDRVYDRRRLVRVGHGRTGEVDTAAGCVRQLPPEGDALVQDLGGLGVVGDAGDGRAAEEQVCAERGINVVREAGHHARHVLHSIPARDLDDERRHERCRRPRLQDVDPAIDSARRAVTAGERDGWRDGAAVEQPDEGQRRPYVPA